MRPVQALPRMAFQREFYTAVDRITSGISIIPQRSLLGKEQYSEAYFLSVTSFAKSHRSLYEHKEKDEVSDAHLQEIIILLVERDYGLRRQLREHARRGIMFFCLTF